jgi:hypothetical protein
VTGDDWSSADPWWFPAQTLRAGGFRGDKVQGDRTDGTLSSPPGISRPKGGGAIRRIEEKYAANPITSTALLSIPIYTSPGRSGFRPQHSLSFDSGMGNSPFGFGWSLPLPFITRKTEKGLPKYQAAVSHRAPWRPQVPFQSANLRNPRPHRQWCPL